MKRGFAHFAVDNHVSVVPIGLSGTKDLWLRKQIRMQIGKPIDPDGHDADALFELATAQLRGLVPPVLGTARSEAASQVPHQAAVLSSQMALKFTCVGTAPTGCTSLSSHL